MKKNQTFEGAMSRLDEIVSQLDSPGLPLDTSLELFGEGAELLAYCEKTLKGAKLRLEELYPQDSGQNTEDVEKE